MQAKSSFAATSQPKPDTTPQRQLSHRSSRETDVASRSNSRRGSVQQQFTRSPKQEVVHEASSSDEDLTQSRMLHRRPNPAARRTTGRRSQHARRPSAPQLDEEDEDDSPAFLPFSNNSSETTKPESSIKQAISSRPAPNRRTTSERVSPPGTMIEPLTSDALAAGEVKHPYTAKLLSASKGFARA